jgi:hypothetical protein
MSFGGNMIWYPGPEIRYDEYDIVEYAYLHNKSLYKWLIEELYFEPSNPGWENFNKQLDEIVTAGIEWIIFLSLQMCETTRPKFWNCVFLSF